MKPSARTADCTAKPDPNPVFVTTHWSIVMAAGRTDSARAETALAQLCKTYWYPIYAYVRQRGHTSEDAKDLTQEFFTRLLENKTLRTIERDKGKFRSFLLTALNHYLMDEWRKAHAQKRGGGQVISLDATDAETRFEREPVEHLTPESIYERNWALALLDRVYERLQQDYETSGRGALFEALKFCLTGDRSTLPYTELGAKLELSETAVKQTVHRLRRHYRELLREEVAQTVATPAGIEEELQCLFRALSGARP